MAVLDEFKKFALKGNVVDLAVGVIIGAAFSQIVTSLVQDVVMPIIGFVTGGLDFSNYFIQLTGPAAQTYADAKAAGATIGYGQFLTVSLNFMIVAWVLFLAVRGINRLRHAEENKPTPVKEVPRQELLLQEIRDLLAERRV